MSKDEPVQPEINVGLVGHVDHGKTTLTEKLTGKWTDTHSEEIKRGITIRLGYADSIFRKCAKCKIFTVKEKCAKCQGPAAFVRKVSFVDAPGHESLMATMLSGAIIMDGALLLISAADECPQPQTREHLMALQIVGVKNVVVVQNKVDLVTEEKAKQNHKQIKDFLSKTPYKDAPIIPVSALYNANIDVLIEAIEKTIPTPARDPNTPPMMFIARSFDINKPGTQIDDLKGGVLGGALKQGKLKVGEDIEIKPGYAAEEKGQKVWKPLITKIIALVTGGQAVKEVSPGGSIAVGTNLDPSIVKSDQFTGNVVGLPGKLPPVTSMLKLQVNLLERVVGSKEELVVEPIKITESLMLNVNSAATVGVVTKLSKDIIECKLLLPVCVEPGGRVTISRRIANRFRLIGYGILKN